MRITFTRTGDRRYRVTAQREGAPDVVMAPAPGFDEYLPHDLAHFLVERHWDLREGIYGDVAAGGDAGTFRPLEAVRDRRWVKKNAGLATSGRDMDRSEALARALLAAWSRHAGRLPAESAYPRDAAAAAGLTLEDFEPLMPTTDEATARWHALAIGESMTLDWPDTERGGAHPSRSGTASRRR
jgi:hypothetical protein